MDQRIAKVRSGDVQLANSEKMGPRGRWHCGDEYCDPDLACKLPMKSDVVYKNVSMSSGTPTIT